MAHAGNIAVDTNDYAALEFIERPEALLYGEFTLSSGIETDYYFDSKKLTLDPEGANFVARCLVEKLNEVGATTVGGMALSAIPIVSHITLYSYLKSTRPIPSFYVRDEAKTHGTMNLLEGQLPSPGSEVVIVDDVITTGKSVLKAIKAVEQAGYSVGKVIAIFDRNEGGREALQQKGYSSWALYTVNRTSEGKLFITFNG
jgi:orotate phosphoribosyltransferase